MKNLLSITLLSFILFSCTTNCNYVQVKIDRATKKPLYQEVVFQNGMSQEEMYLKANVWLARYFVDSKSVISYSDAKSGYIIGKGTFTVYGGAVQMGYVTYVIEVLVKDGKSKISIDQFSSELYGFMTGIPNENYPYEDCIYSKIDKHSQDIINNFKNNAFKPTSSEF